jgi:hypothetical protein
MPWGAVAAAGIGLVGSAIGSSTQASAAEQAAQDQEQAAMAQMGLDSNVFNAQSEMQLPSREVGGLAQSREAYLLGLDPNLNISQDFMSPQISFNQGTGSSTLGYTDSNGNSVGTPASPGSPGSTQLPNGQWVMGSGGVATGAGSQAGYPNPNAIYGGGAGYGSTGPVSFGGGTYGTATPASYSGIGASMLPSSVTGGAAGGAPAAGGAGGAPNPNAAAGSAYGSFASPYNPSTFYQDPGYQFILGQGQQAISNQQATSGLALSPSALSAALGYTTGLASQEFNNAYNRSMNTQTTQLNELNALSSGGQIATSGVSSAASGLGTAGSSAIAGYGNAGAAGAIGVGNAYSSGINGATNSLMYGMNSPMGSSLFSSGFGSTNSDPYATMQTPPAGYQWSSDGSTIVPSPS